MNMRRTHSHGVKARVAMEAISGRKAIQEIAADHAIHPIKVGQLRRRLLNEQVSTPPTALRRGCCLGGWHQLSRAPMGE